MAEKPRLASERIRVDNSADAVNDLYYQRGWTDGLPVIPPTEEKVRAMLGAVSRDPQQQLAVLAPKMGIATVEKVAINAVMAGCLPEYLPVLLAAVAAVAEEKYNLLGVQTTTHPCGSLVVINGPIAKKLGVNSGGNAFGPGFRANATIGRALALILRNIGGAIPQQTDRATHGQPGKFTSCVAENEEANPWAPLHVERGFRAGESTVTVFAAEAPHNINDHESLTGEGVLKMAAATMATAGNNNLTYYTGEPILVLGPEHAATIARDGFSKEQVKDYIFEHARLPVEKLSEENRRYRRGPDVDFEEFGQADFAPLSRRKDIVVLVVGGDGRHSLFVPTFGLSYSSTKLITD